MEEECFFCRLDAKDKNYFNKVNLPDAKLCDKHMKEDKCRFCGFPYNNNNLKDHYECIADITNKITTSSNCAFCDLLSYKKPLNLCLKHQGCMVGYCTICDYKINEKPYFLTPIIWTNNQKDESFSFHRICYKNKRKTHKIKELHKRIDELEEMVKDLLTLAKM